MYSSLLEKYPYTYCTVCEPEFQDEKITKCNLNTSSDVYTGFSWITK